MEKNIVKLNEEQLQKVVTESVTRYLKESIEKGEIDERFLGNLRDKIGAAKDTFTKGGSYAAHFNNRQLQGARSDIENLKEKYGVQNGQNGTQYVNQNSQQAVAQINAKYDQKIQALEAQRQQEIAKAQGKVQKQWNKYQGKKQSLDQTRNQAYQGRRTAMNANPYADFAEE